MMLKNKKTIIAISLIPQYFLVQLLSNFPEFIEHFYSQGLYTITSKLLRFTFGWIPFSIGDLLYTLAGIYIIRWFIINRKRIRKDTKNWCVDILSTIALVYFAFHLFWGMNYYRLPIHQTLNLDYQYTTAELIDVTNQLIEKTNAVHLQITQNDSIKVDIQYSKAELLALSDNGYFNLANKIPELSLSPSSTKLSLYSLPLTYMGFSGYLNPFTNEAQIDGLIPLFNYPSTISHEKGHQIGYAAENETNFIGVLATIYNDDIYYNYSGYANALRHCLNEIYRRDKATYDELISMVNIGVRKNYQEIYEFWNAYENPLEPIFKFTYSNFLKANNQDKGIESYSYAVALIVNYFKVNPI